MIRTFESDNRYLQSLWLLFVGRRANKFQVPFLEGKMHSRTRMHPNRSIITHRFTLNLNHNLSSKNVSRVLGRQNFDFWFCFRDPLFCLYHIYFLPPPFPLTSSSFTAIRWFVWWHNQYNNFRLDHHRGLFVCLLVKSLRAYKNPKITTFSRKLEP